MQVNPQNERLKMAWTKELSKDLHVSTVDQKLAALGEYEAATDYENLTALSEDSVARFIAATLARDVASKTRNSTVRHVKAFFEWTVMAEHIKGKRAHGPIRSLRLSRKDKAAGRAAKQRPLATLEQIRSTVLAMPKTSAVERRNRALIAFAIVSGARDGAIITMRVKHVDLIGKEVMQHPDEVDTKGSRQIFTWFFPVGDEMIAEVADYIAYLREELSFGDDDPLFPSTALGHDENDQFCRSGLSKRHWATAQPMRDIYREAFASNGLPYFNPHSFRKTLMVVAYDMGLQGETLKAWSQNLGNKKLDTSINSYGNVSKDRQKARILALHDAKPMATDTADTIAKIKALAASLQPPV